MEGLNTYSLKISSVHMNVNVTVSYLNNSLHAIDFIKPVTPQSWGNIRDMISADEDTMNARFNVFMSMKTTLFEFKKLTQ